MGRGEEGRGRESGGLEERGRESEWGKREGETDLSVGRMITHTHAHTVNNSENVLEEAEGSCDRVNGAR